MALCAFMMVSRRCPFNTSRRPIGVIGRGLSAQISSTTIPLFINGQEERRVSEVEGWEEQRDVGGGDVVRGSPLSTL